jgi:hypothetical protein
VAWSIRGLAVALRWLLAGAAVALAVAVFGWIREFVLIGDVERRPGSVTLATYHSAEHVVHGSYDVLVLLALAVAVVHLVWFYRARRNAGTYHDCRQRYRQPWAIAGWLIPLVNLVVPYQMTRDILLASEHGPGSDRAGARRPIAVVTAWWAMVLISIGLGTIAHQIGHTSNLRTYQHAVVIEVFADLLAILGMLLFVSVINRVTRAQTRRANTWTREPATTAWAATPH